MRGRKPKSAEQRRLGGNAGHRPIREGPQFSSGETLAAPDRWPEGGAEREEWGRIVPELIRCGIAKSVHQGLLECMCELYAASRTSMDLEHFTAARLAMEAHRKFLGEFGLTPATASRVGGTSAFANVDGDAEKFFTGPKAVTDTE